MATYAEPARDLAAGTRIKSGVYHAVAYALKAEYAQTGAQHQEFLDFYESSIMNWLKDAKLDHVYAWLIGDWVVCVGPRKMAVLPWVGGIQVGGIQGLRRYLAHEAPLPVTKLPSYEG